MASEIAEPRKSQVVTFDNLWQAYPSFAEPCDQRKYENQCAIRLGVALEKAGVNLGSFNGARCGVAEHKPQHLLRAHEIASWLNTRPFTAFQDARFSRVKTAKIGWITRK